MLVRNSNDLACCDRTICSDCREQASASAVWLRASRSTSLTTRQAQMLRDLEQYLTEKDWTTSQEGGEMQFVPEFDGDETLLLACSADRRAKDLAVNEKFSARLDRGCDSNVVK